MIMAYWGFIIFMALFASNANELANWQLTVPAKEHISSYQIVSDNWKIHYSINGNEYQYYNDSAQKTPAVRKNVRGMNAPITNNATIIPTGFSSGIVGFSWPDVLQNAVIRCIALLFQEKHFR